MLRFGSLIISSLLYGFVQCKSGLMEIFSRFFISKATMGKFIASEIIYFLTDSLESYTFIYIYRLTKMGHSVMIYLCSFQWIKST